MTSWRRFDLVKAERDTAERKLAVAVDGLARLAVEVEVLIAAAERVIASWTDPLDDDVHGEAVAALDRLVASTRTPPP